MLNKLFSIVVILFGLPALAGSECTTGYCVEGVSITRKDRKKVTGYVEWNAKNYKGGAAFPSSFIDESKFAAHYQGHTFSLYTEILPAPYPSGLYLSDSSHRVDFSLSDVSSVDVADLKYSDQDGNLMEVSESNFALVKGAEFFGYRSAPEEECETVLLSYNPAYEGDDFSKADAGKASCRTKNIVCLEICAE